MVEVRAGELVAQLGGELLGDPDKLLRRIDGLETAGPDAISFLANPRLQPLLQTTEAGCLIVQPALRAAVQGRAAAILSDDPYLYYARLSRWWAQRSRAVPAAGVHPSAVVEPGARRIITPRPHAHRPRARARRRPAGPRRRPPLPRR